MVPDDYLRGHGTFVSPADGELKSSVAGTVERINKLVTVRPFKVRPFT
jgi:exosome complex component RRP4